MTVEPAAVKNAAEEWDPERDAAERGPSHKTVICYNSACTDYRRPRNDGSKCSCQRTKIQGGGV